MKEQEAARQHRIANEVEGAPEVLPDSLVGIPEAQILALAEAAAPDQSPIDAFAPEPRNHFVLFLFVGLP